MHLSLAATAGLALGVVSAQDGELPVNYKKWRVNPKMIVFGDSISDAGRRFNAPASFDYPGIGKFPFERLFEDADSDSMFRAYLPETGSPTNGKVWPSWLRVPEEYNFATSSASASETFRDLDTCGGYTGEGEKLPTGFLSDQITRYISDVLDHTDETLDYTHVIVIGNNEPGRVLAALNRYGLGGDGYVDPVAFENVFEIVDGVPSLTFEPMIREVVAAWQEGIERLLARGVTGRILLANSASPKGFPSGLGDLLDQVAIAGNIFHQELVDAYPQVRAIDFYNLTAAIIDYPEVFFDVGITGGSGASLSDSCLLYDFAIDTAAEVMGIQAERAEGCQGECDLCADSTSPCQNCYEGNPSATACEDPEKYIFWDSLHFTTGVHQVLADAIRQCSKDEPNYDTPWAEILCPMDV
eukprot:jgi/Undpi1/12153/HiC_scaffold_5.g01829.m1